MGALQQHHQALGAHFAEAAGAPVVRHYGDTAAEYTAVREAVGVVDRADLAQFRLRGRDPVKMLQGLITNDLAGAPPGYGVYAGMLTPKGKMIADLRAFTLRRGDDVEVLAVVPREAREGTAAHLKKFVPPMFARWEDVSQSVGALGVYGPRSRDLLTDVLGEECSPLEEDAFRETTFGTEPLLLVGTRYAGGEQGYDLFAAADALPALWDALLARGAGLGARPVGHGPLESLRIEAGYPRYGHELTEETIPTEAYQGNGMMERAISFGKGCYTGQEVIVRIAHRGHVNRLLRGLLLGDRPSPAPRTPLFDADSGKEVGWTTSAAFSPRLGQEVALGFVRRQVEPGGRVRLGGVEGAEVEVTTLPLARP